MRTIIIIGLCIMILVSGCSTGLNKEEIKKEQIESYEWGVECSKTCDIMEEGDDEVYCACTPNGIIIIGLQI